MNQASLDRIVASTKPETLDEAVAALTRIYPNGGPVEEVYSRLSAAKAGDAASRAALAGKPGVIVDAAGRPVSSAAPAYDGQTPPAEPFNEREEDRELLMNIEGMVNQAMLQDTSKECERVVSEFEAFDADGKEIKLVAPSPAKLQEMQNWAHRCRKRHPTWSEARVVKATASFFNIHILPNSALDNESD